MSWAWTPCNHGAWTLAFVIPINSTLWRRLRGSRGGIRAIDLLIMGMYKTRYTHTWHRWEVQHIFMSCDTPGRVCRTRLFLEVWCALSVLFLKTVYGQTTSLVDQIGTETQKKIALHPPPRFPGLSLQGLRVQYSFLVPKWLRKKEEKKQLRPTCQSRLIMHKVRLNLMHMWDIVTRTRFVMGLSGS